MATKKKTSSSPGSLRAEEFRNPSLAMYEMYSPSRAPGSTVESYNVGAGSTPPAKPASGASGGPSYANMLQALQKLSAMSQKNIGSSMDTLTQALQAQTNPYENFQAQNTATTPELASLLQSQGVPTDPLQQYAAITNAQNTGQADAFKNIVNTLSAYTRASQQGAVSDVAQQRADLLNALQGNIFASGASLMGKKAPDRNAIVQMLLSGLRNRG